MTEPLTPTCPRCHEPPIMVLAGGGQAFCGTDECDVLAWNPTQTAAEFEANARPVVPTDADGNPVDWPD